MQKLNLKKSENSANITLMIDIEKQIEFWVEGAEAALDTARILIKKKKHLHGLFFCHLTIEKIIKAHVVRETSQIPPKSHNLFRLLENTGIEVTEEDAEFFGILMKYQLEGRYPDYNPQIPEKRKVKEYFQKTKEMLLWLKKKLSR
ncbi:MAG: HEPN domain-containing protein [Candidatus Aminicenantes bacterium]|jgi:HEPN domain-containing protein